MFEKLKRKPKIHGKLKQKEKDLLTCFLCEHYQASSLRQYVHDTKHLRKCAIDGKYKDIESPSCPSFQLAKYFYCSRVGQRVASSVCRNRQDERRNGCSRSCKGYGKLIHKILGKGEENEIRQPVSGTTGSILREVHDSKPSNTEVIRKALRRS